MVYAAKPIQHHQAQQQGTTTTNNKDIRLDFATQLFQKELDNLYKSCMLKAGFTSAEANSGSMAHKRFAVMAWKGECERLQVLLGEKDSTTTTASTNSVDDTAALTTGATCTSNTPNISQIRFGI